MLAVLMVVVLRMLGLFMIYPVFSSYAMALPDATPTAVGFALGIYGLTQVLFQIPLGLLSDRLGRRAVIRGGFLLFAVGSVLVAQATSITLLIMGRSVQGISAIGGVLMALMADVTNERDRVWAMALLGVAMGCAFLLAMVLGPFISYYAGVHSVFWFSGILSLLAMVVISVGVRDSPPPVLSHATMSWNAINGPMIRLLLPLQFGVFVLHAGFVILFLILPGILEKLVGAQGMTWYFYAQVLGGSWVCSGLWLWWLQRRQRPVVDLVVAIGVFGLAEWSFLWADVSLLRWAMAVGLFFTAFNVLEASLPTLVSQRAPFAWRGTAMSLYSMAQFLGIFSGGVIGGWLNEHCGMVALVAFGCGLTGLWLVWTLQQIKRGCTWQEASIESF